MVMKLRTFYLYQINDFCKNIYDIYPYRLYHILKDIYYTSKYNQTLAISSYEDIIDKFNKLYINEYIYQNNKLNIFYQNSNHTHIYSSQKEISKLMVSSYSLKIKTNLNYSTFFSCIDKYSNNIFICDFENNDYFWLHKIIHYEKNLIKE